MKVLHIINDSGLGGAQTLIENLAIEGRNNGVEVHCVVLSTPGKLAPRLERACASVKHLSIRRSSWRIDTALKQLVKEIRFVNPDVVQSHLLQSDLISSLALLIFRKKPLLWTIHSSGYGDGDRFRTRILARVIRFASFRVDRVISCTAAASKFSIETGISKQKIVEIPNGVVMPTAQLRKGETGDLVHVGRPHLMKDHSMLLLAFSRIATSWPSCGLTFIGVDKSELDVLNRGGIDIDQLPITALGALSDPIPVIRKSKFLIISSAYGEALPMVGIEALSYGVPVLTTNVGSCSLLAAESWMVCAPRDSDGLADLIRKALALTDTEYDALSIKARLKAESSFNIRNTAASYATVYSSVVESA